MDIDLTTLKKPDKKKDTSNQKWTKEQEELLASWSERAAGYRWLHSRSEKLYRCRNYTFTIPVIILSTLTGTANFAMDSFVPETHKQMAMACVGGVNIFAGILSTLQNFLRYAELMESHRVCEVSWSKLSRDIAVELTLEPKMRKPAFDFLNVCRAEYDRLIEQSPPIDDDIIKKYKGEFRELEEDFNHPLVCNGLHKCKVFIPSEDEKKAKTVAEAGEKLLNLKKNKWNNNVNTEFKRKITVKPDKIDKTDINKELKSLNKVSQFKKSMVDHDDEDKHPMEKINDIIKSSKSDIETGIIDDKISDKISETTNLIDETLEDNIEDISNQVIEDTIDKVLSEIDDKGKND
tara:strand:+ start:5125 stop:6171 length:1047 start_codon:yes stop_codon:yes gene_type:complete